MRVVAQRVSQASVTVEGEVVGKIDGGLLLLLGVTDGDGVDQSRWLSQKVANLRIFRDDEGKLNRSLLDVEGSALVVSQFTLYGDCKKGRRPSFVKAAHPSLAEPLYERFCEDLRELGVPVQTGIFGAMMDVGLVNDGPVTLILDAP